MVPVNEAMTAVWIGLGIGLPAAFGLGYLCCLIFAKSRKG